MSFECLVPRKRAHSNGLTRRQTFPFWPLNDEFGRIFDDFFGRQGLRSLDGFENRLTKFRPALNVSEDDKAIHVAAELPGVDEKDIEVTLENDVLTIRGEKKDESEDDSRGYNYRECSYGAFERSISLPDHVDTEKVKAKFKSGVLSVEIAKKEDGTPTSRKIAITTK